LTQLFAVAMPAALSRAPPMITLQALIENSTVSDLKELLVYFPEACKVGRKEVLTASLSQQMTGDGLLRAWEQLDACQRLASARRRTMHTAFSLIVGKAGRATESFTDIDSAASTG
jgi:hypothetical protein